MKNENRDIQIITKILRYCEEIDITHREYHKNYDAFSRSPTYLNAICMCLLQIGELANHLSNEFISKHNDIQWKAIRGMRNVIAHEYGIIDHATVWETVNDDIDVLKKFCQEALDIDSNDFELKI